MPSKREKRPPNRWGCKPEEDVCVEHDEPLKCRHGCSYAKLHQCKDRTRQEAKLIADGSLLSEHEDGNNNVRLHPDA